MLLLNCSVIFFTNSSTKNLPPDPNTRSSIYIWTRNITFFPFLTNIVLLAFSLVYPLVRTYSDRLSYHALGAYFNPYKAFFSLYIWFWYFGSSIPLGYLTYTFSLRSLFKKVLGFVHLKQNFCLSVYIMLVPVFTITCLK